MPAYAYVASQPLESSDPLGLFEAPCDVFGDPCGGGPGPCDRNQIGWDPWPAPGCGGLGGWGFSVYPILPSGGGGGAILGGSGASAPPGPCTAGICPPSSEFSAEPSPPGLGANAWLAARLAGSGLADHSGFHVAVIARPFRLGVFAQASRLSARLTA